MRLHHESAERAGCRCLGGASPHQPRLLPL